MVLRPALCALLAVVLLAPDADARRRSESYTVDDLNTKGKRQFRNGNYPSAAAFFHVVYELDDQRYEALLNEALAYRRAQEYERALAAYEQAYDLDKNHPDALFGLAETHRLMGKTKTARDLFVTYLATEKRKGKQALVDFAQEKIKDLEPAKKGTKKETTALNHRTDDGVNTAFHKKHQGEIVFATKPLSARSKDRDTQSTFRLSDPIHFLALLKESMGNSFRTAGTECSIDEESAGNLVYRLSVNNHSVPGNKELYREPAPSQLFEKWTAFRVPESLTDENPAGPDVKTLSKAFSIHALDRFSPGKNKVELVLAAQCRGRTKNGAWKDHEKIVAQGSFTLLVDKGDIDVAKKRLGPRLPKPAVNDKNLAGRMMSAMDARYGKRKKVLSVVPLERDWTDQTDDRGRASERTRNAFVVVRSTKGQCELWNTVFVEERKKKGWGETQVAAVGDTEPFHCLNAN